MNQMDVSLVTGTLRSLRNEAMPHSGGLVRVIDVANAFANSIQRLNPELKFDKVKFIEDCGLELKPHNVIALNKGIHIVEDAEQLHLHTLAAQAEPDEFEGDV